LTLRHHVVKVVISGRKWVIEELTCFFFK
jgi:hypothetical protein